MSNETLREKQIISSGDESHGSHRGDFETCPHCQTTLTESYWDENAHTFCLRPRIFRSGCGSIISECPKCFESSWVHIELDSVEYNQVPKQWKQAAAKESTRLKLVALRRWGESLCWQCMYLVSGTVQHTTRRSCENISWSGSGEAKLDCEKFLAV